MLEPLHGLGIPVSVILEDVAMTVKVVSPRTSLADGNDLVSLVPRIEILMGIREEVAEGGHKVFGTDIETQNGRNTFLGPVASLHRATFPTEVHGLLVIELTDIDCVLAE